MNLNNLLFYCFHILCFVCCSAQISNKNDNKTSEMILNDMRDAFKLLTNNTKQLNDLINEKYAKFNNQTDDCFVFKLPDSDANNGSLNVVSMIRSDFTKPTFPYLSRDYMKNAVNKIRRVTMSNQNDSTGDDEWRLMGLDGWSGSISPQSEPSLKITNGVRSPEANESKDDVYIARANNPFGFSTKWQLRKSFSIVNTTDHRAKRDVIKLYSMIKCSTGCDPIVYKGYGCYCGFLGAGTPVDGIDRCCKLHDKCYENSNCVSYLEYFIPYIWKCYRGKPLCATSHGEWGGPRSCAARLCSCDLRLSRCLRNFTCPGRRAVCPTSSARQIHNFLFFK